MVLIVGLEELIAIRMHKKTEDHLTSIGKRTFNKIAIYTHHDVLFGSTIRH